MLAFVEEFYEHENTFGDSAICQEEFNQMNNEIKGAYNGLILKVSGIAKKVFEKKISFERQNEAELIFALNDA